jgi:hypothetical protein
LERPDWNGQIGTARLERPDWNGQVGTAISSGPVGFGGVAQHPPRAKISSRQKMDRTVLFRKMKYATLFGAVRDHQFDSLMMGTL